MVNVAAVGVGHFCPNLQDAMPPIPFCLYTALQCAPEALHFQRSLLQAAQHSSFMNPIMKGLYQKIPLWNKGRKGATGAALRVGRWECTTITGHMVKHKI